MSKLEDDLAFALYALAHNENAPWPYADPVREFEVEPKCCEHAKRTHLVSTVPGYVAICQKCPLASRAHDYRPHYRWDFAWPDLKVAVECNGGVWSGGAHGRPKGILRDYDKANRGRLAGWTLIAVTQRDVTSGEALRLIARALEDATAARSVA
jgi:hypothetical protein